MEYLFAKASPESNCSHLYEHMFIDAAIEKLRESRLFAFVDYTISGRTYGRGLLFIEIEIWNKSAKNQILDIIHSTKIDANDIESGVLQILAEKQAGLYELNKNAISQMLQILNQTPWFETSKVKPVRLERYANVALVLSQVDKTEFDNFSAKIFIDKKFVDDSIKLLPLFNILSRTIMANIDEDIASRYSCYSSGGSRTFSQTKSTFRIFRKHIPKLTDEADHAIDLIKYMMDESAFDRLSKQLATENIPVRLTEEIYANTGSVIGKPGWRQIATAENITEVLSKSMISFKRNKVVLQNDISTIF